MRPGDGGAGAKGVTCFPLHAFFCLLDAQIIYAEVEERCVFHDTLNPHVQHPRRQSPRIRSRGGGEHGWPPFFHFLFFLLPFLRHLHTGYQA
ncbi:hypothetical protein LZ31DRAFT_7047 [Colletotrichum somersetense]|nr:hypothetical protein LZ31DRAFT_7047 [Colletotrichum somersetense]